MIRSAVARANSNIAFIKYWGKRDEGLNLPMNSSFSMTLDSQLSTTTKIEFSPEYKKDSLVLNNKEQSGIKRERVSKHLDIIRKIAKTKLKAKVTSENSFPTGAGIASSASGFAALTAAACEALGLRLTAKQLSTIARLGSGSAARSFHDGFVEWQKGNKKNGSDSYGVQFRPASYWPELRDIIVITDEKEKKVSSRKGMQLTVKTSKLYKRRIQRVENVLKALKKAVEQKDKETLFEIIMADSDNMHATMHDTKPALDYLNKTSHKIIDLIIRMNENETLAGYNFDAGSTAHIITTFEWVDFIRDELRKIKGIKKIIVSRAGEGISVTNTSESIVKAYGKVLVYGGYGILENGTGLVVNVDKGTTTRAMFSDKDKIITHGIKNQKFAKAAIETAKDYLKSNKKILIESVNDKELNPNKNKSGFGSSATAVVSIIAAILDLHGREINTIAGRNLVCRLAKEAHSKAQGKIGSGFDISAACFGSQFFSKKRIEKAEWPNWKTVLAFTGKSASTTCLVRKINDYKKNNNKKYYKIINKCNKINKEAKFNIKKIEESQRLRKELGEKAKADIETNSQTKILQEAKEHGALFAVLPGAGGGDTILAVCKTEKERKKAINYFKKKKMHVFERVNIADKPYEILL